MEETEARAILAKEVEDERTINSGLNLIANELGGMPTFTHRGGFEKLRKVLQEGSLISLSKVQAKLRIKGGDYTLDVLSSYPGPEITDIVPIVNSNLRYKRFLYTLKKGVELNSILGPLEKIIFSLGEGHLSRREVEGILGRKRLFPSARFFDSVVEASFERKEDGTYKKESADAFKSQTEGYKFLNMVGVLRDKTKSFKFFESLNYYQGDLTIRMHINNTPSYNRRLPRDVYLFKHDKEGNIDLSRMGLELGVDLEG